MLISALSPVKLRRFRLGDDLDQSEIRLAAQAMTNRANALRAFVSTDIKGCRKCTSTY